MNDDAALAGRILEVALMLGERSGWDALHLYDIADDMGIGLDEIHRHYRTKDDLAEAWFERADRALVRIAAREGWAALSCRERLEQAILAWLEALAPHRQLTAQMLRYKLQPEHLHLQVQGLLHISSTVQWIRESARLPESGWRREMEEVVLTGIFLSTFGFWLRDGSPDAGRTQAWLERQLRCAERLALRRPVDKAPARSGWTRSPMP
ncbi:TetR/AcrR family transcriptional regulator [Cupriavidus necator]|uniref:TetR/AcrR family transcriptional regulator n=1 Tax=Cupriavidus necator TaxID=106590 RepID=UPI0005B2F89F|nr:TetR/AcrR family transcriptional regulator [Cupriavidus necator]